MTLQPTGYRAAPAAPAHPRLPHAHVRERKR
jgi:hypothetical protein